MKDRYGVRHFYRYMDDIVVGASDKRFLWLVRDEVHEQIESNGQMSKFFTNSDEMKTMLDAMRGTLDTASIAVTIRSEPFQGGGGTRYYFDD